MLVPYACALFPAYPQVKRSSVEGKSTELQTAGSGGPYDSGPLANFSPASLAVPMGPGSRVALESVRKHQAGLQSFRSIRRIEARRRNASALRLRFSQSLASLRQRLSQAMVRSTIQRLGNTTNPLA